VQALVDPETSLFNYGFLNYKLDEEFKRAQRFRHPLSCVMLGFEGQANEECLSELSSAANDAAASVPCCNKSLTRTRIEVFLSVDRVLRIPRDPD